MMSEDRIIEVGEETYRVVTCVNADGRPIWVMRVHDSKETVIGFEMVSFSPIDDGMVRDIATGIQLARREAADRAKDEARARIVAALGI